MPREFPRHKRVAEQIQRVMAESVTRGQVRADGIQFATFTEVEVSRDLSHAKIYVSRIGSDDPSPLVDILNEHAVMLRKEIARKLTLRSVPQIRFFPDTSTATGDYMDRLIAAARKSDPHPDDSEDNDQGDGHGA